MLEVLGGAPEGDVVVLHGCCHNPTGVDLRLAQWEALAELLVARRLLPLVDFAYQGFANGLREDAIGLEVLSARLPELLVASSYSKNFGLYSERVGALTLVAATSHAGRDRHEPRQAGDPHQLLEPPGPRCGGRRHGAHATRRCGPSGRMKSAEMRDRINTMRHLFVESLQEQGVDQDFSFIAHQRGMFSFSGLTPGTGEGIARPLRNLHRRFGAHQRGRDDRRQHGLSVWGDPGGHPRLGLWAWQSGP